MAEHPSYAPRESLATEDLQGEASAHGEAWVRGGWAGYGETRDETQDANQPAHGDEACLSAEKEMKKIKMAHHYFIRAGDIEGAHASDGAACWIPKGTLLTVVSFATQPPSPWQQNPA